VLLSGTNRSKFGTQKYCIASVGREVYGCVMKLEVLMWGVETKSVQKAISLLVIQIQKCAADRSRSWGYWLADVEIHYIR
jgi:hypothetical protein